MDTTEQLKEAQTAYHNLQTGQMAVSVTKDGRQVTFNRANIHQLKTYIDELKAKLGAPSSRRRAPARVIC